MLLFLKGDANMTAGRDKSYFSTVEILFMASMIGLDFAYGLVVGPILTATGVLEFIRVDMIVPIMMLLVTRLVVDRFGTLVVYEFVWVMLAILARPGTMGLPGFFKFLPALGYGLILDACMSTVRRPLYLRLLVAGVIGGIVNQFSILGIKMLFGMPWSAAVQVLLGINLLTTVIVNLLGVQLADNDIKKTNTFNEMIDTLKLKGAA